MFMFKNNHVSGLRKQHIDGYFDNHREIYSVAKLTAQKGHVKILLIRGLGVAATVSDCNTGIQYSVQVSFSNVPVKSHLFIDPLKCICKCTYYKDTHSGRCAHIGATLLQVKDPTPNSLYHCCKSSYLSAI